MNAERLIDRLEGVRQSGPGRWLARCPAHPDHSPSLSVRETDDGTVLIKCFAGCDAADVVAATGLEFKDLFPEKPQDAASRRDFRHTHAAREALKILAHESLVALCAAENMAHGRHLTDADRERLTLAAVRIRHAREAAA